MQKRSRFAIGTASLLAAAIPAGMLALTPSCVQDSDEITAQADEPICAQLDPVVKDAKKMIEQGRRTFRFDTFGDEDLWGGKLHLHQAIAGQAHGGVGPGLSPIAALALGLKVDVDALPASLIADLQGGHVDLNDPATTLALLKLDAVVGLTGFFDAAGSLTSVGIQCALCHSTVNNSFSCSVGNRLDGWPNRDLNVGAIIALAPTVAPLANI